MDFRRQITSEQVHRVMKRQAKIKQIVERTFDKLREHFMEEKEKEIKEMKQRIQILQNQIKMLSTTPVSRKDYVEEATRIAEDIIQRELGKKEGGKHQRETDNVLNDVNEPKSPSLKTPDGLNPKKIKEMQEKVGVPEEVKKIGAVKIVEKARKKEPIKKEEHPDDEKIRKFLAEKNKLPEL